MLIAPLRLPPPSGLRQNDLLLLTLGAMGVAGLESKEQAAAQTAPSQPQRGGLWDSVSFFGLFDHLTIHERTGELP